MSIKLYTNNHKEDSTIQKLWKKSMPDWIDVGMDKDSLKALRKLDNVEVCGFVGGFEVDITVLQDNVPNTFPDNTYIDEQEQEQTYTFENYCNYKVSLDNTKVVLIIGKTNSNGNRTDIVCNDELTAWIDYFGEDNVLTKSAMQTLLASAAYTQSVE